MRGLAPLPLLRASRGGGSVLRIPVPAIEAAAQIMCLYDWDFVIALFHSRNAVHFEVGDNGIETFTRNWLLAQNRYAVTNGVSALPVLAGVIEPVMDHDEEVAAHTAPALRKWKAHLERILAASGLRHELGGNIVAVAHAGPPTRELEAIIRSRNLGALHEEYERAARQVISDPAAALTAASALLEAFCKVYAHEQKLPVKDDMTGKALWSLIYKDLGFDPAKMVDDDLKRVLSGLTSIVDGVASARSHAGSAHGRGPTKNYTWQPRHARLAVGSAFTLVTFCLETWAERAKVPAP